MDKHEEKDIEREVLKAKIRSLEVELIELKRVDSLMFTALKIGINKMETSLRDKLVELNKELRRLK